MCSVTLSRYCWLERITVALPLSAGSIHRLSLVTFCLRDLSADCRGLLRLGVGRGGLDRVCVTSAAMEEAMDGGSCLVEDCIRAAMSRVGMDVGVGAKLRPWESSEPKGGKKITAL